MLIKFNHKLNSFFWPHCMACGILVLGPKLEPIPCAVEVWSLHHWTPGKSLNHIELKLTIKSFQKNSKLPDKRKDT